MPAPKITAYQRVADSIHERILTGYLQAGQRLPTESDLAEEFSVSRSTVREALRSLASRKFIVTTRGVAGGSFVVTPQPGELSEQMAESLERLAGADRISLTELLEAREILEVPASGLAARRRTPEELAELEASVPSGDGDEESTGPRNFHALIVRASGNLLLETVTRPLFGVIRRRYMLDQMPESFWEGVFEEHRRILDAIRTSDALHAEYAMQEHLRHLRRAYGLIHRKEMERAIDHD